MSENYQPFSLVKEKSKRTEDFTDKDGKKMQKTVVIETKETAMYYTDRALAQMALEQMKSEDTSE